MKHFSLPSIFQTYGTSEQDDSDSKFFRENSHSKEYGFDSKASVDQYTNKVYWM